MSEFSVHFDMPLIDAQAVGELFRVSQSNGEYQKTQDGLLSQANDSITGQRPNSIAVEKALNEVLAELKSQRAEIETIATKYSIEIVRLLLGSTSELIEKRLQQNIECALEGWDGHDSATLFVHSSFHDLANQWLNEETTLKINGQKWNVMSDDQLEAGDCRIEFGQTGRQTSLDEQLRLVESRILQATSEKHDQVSP